MTKRIFHNILAAAICVFLSSALLFMTVLYDYFSSVQQSQMRVQLDFAAQGVLHGGIDYFNGLDEKKYRITWIGTDGSVLYDSTSKAEEMENHFQREEVKKALAEGYGDSSRYSSTLTERYLYSAKRLSDGTVLRISVAQNSLLVLTFGMLQPICVIFAAAVVLSIILASRLSKKIVEPLNDLNLDEPLNNEGYDELNPLLHRIDMQQRQILSQKIQLKQKQNEFETLTKGMAEGIVLLDGKGFILTINPAAEALLQTDFSAAGKNILSINRAPELSALLEAAESGSYAEKVMTMHGGIYRISANPVTEGDKIPGVVLLILDITEKENAEQMRREFTANVSHELKTPLQTISGCAELLSNGIVKAEDVPSFSAQIYTESKRMIRLVEDIIKLSHLDEGADDMKRENTDLFVLAGAITESLASEAEKAEIKIELQGESAVIYAVPQLLESIVYNLCDNAIKYNRKGGTVCVTVESKDSEVLLCVADTGIGISPEHQQRIFERFYRVDKSRSKEIGGTGLGLSIVKHAARLHDAKIELHSVPEEGTAITVRFPKKIY